MLKNQISAKLVDPNFNGLIKKYPCFRSLTLVDVVAKDQLSIHTILEAMYYQRNKTTDTNILGRNPDKDQGAELKTIE